MPRTARAHGEAEGGRGGETAGGAEGARLAKLHGARAQAGQRALDQQAPLLEVDHQVVPQRLLQAAAERAGATSQGRVTGWVRRLIRWRDTKGKAKKKGHLGEDFWVANDDQPVFGAGQSDIQAARVVEKADALRGSG